MPCSTSTAPLLYCGIVSTCAELSLEFSFSFPLSLSLSLSLSDECCCCCCCCCCYGHPLQLELDEYWPWTEKKLSLLLLLCRSLSLSLSLSHLFSSSLSFLPCDRRNVLVRSVSWCRGPAFCVFLRACVRQPFLFLFPFILLLLLRLYPLPPTSNLFLSVLHHLLRVSLCIRRCMPALGRQWVVGGRGVGGGSYCG